MSAQDPNAILALVAERLAEAAEMLRKLSGSSGTPLPVPVDTSKCADVQPETLTAAEFADVLGVHERTLRRWAHRGKAPKAMRVGNVLRWKRATVELWMKERAK